MQETLDPALTRPGRFDRRVAVPLPDVRGRLEILEHYLKVTNLTLQSCQLTICEPVYHYMVNLLQICYLKTPLGLIYIFICQVLGEFRVVDNLWMNSIKLYNLIRRPTCLTGWVSLLIECLCQATISLSAHMMSMMLWLGSTVVLGLRATQLACSIQGFINIKQTLYRSLSSHLTSSHTSTELISAFCTNDYFAHNRHDFGGTRNSSKCCQAWC